MIVLQNVYVNNIAAVNNQNDFLHLVILLWKFKLQITNPS